ncbi:hypothetical protein OsJ_03769 [Oryza sativa Japonica Group]|uniref:Uncharacterized protein n=1 Tax=Oryza sativa subsp. japonica TaxID=39947 RepID=A2ZYP8_ORYSJ|nr:hypothetical protein OsJ_03769 [Oryza sativa Japonica Group]
MELATHDLAALGAADLVRVSASIPRAAPRTFALLTAGLVFPLSAAVLVHSLFTHPIILRLQGANGDYSSSDSAQWLKLFAVISVLEPLCGLAAMTKSKQLLQGRTRTAGVLVVSYFAACGVTAVLFRAAVVKGRGEEGSLGLSLPGRVLAGAVLVSVLVCVNLLGLLVQSVFYYACKAFHNQQIDRSALYEHLGGYLGEYVPLKSNIQMENLDA